ncbi:uncharacterized protein BX663DRAFT_486188 [Cokeromyces recurvatus]|uniref:uncharacterized protein n=1 Tax=Cokeromyces recurvatus TaxID=90255 RepID=UPI00221E4F3C|nr:uncharacterized protein BX663DRAFT_486188 [Cokeromyces recurvatus]KAI7902893.1 hypothetical protein BX663DRAFT_486188 [Cokeromyces recurvatus]
MLLQIFLPTFFENEEYEDFQAPTGFRPPLPTITKEQRDIKEATRLSLQMRRIAESDDDFQEPIAPQPRTARTAHSATAPVQASTQSSGMIQEFEKVVSLTPSALSESSSTPVHLSEKVKMKQARSEVKRKARQESSTTEFRVATAETEAIGPRARRTKFVIKTKLKAMLRAENFNQVQRTLFVTEVHRVVHHLSDVTFAASLFLNWFCLRLLKNGEAIPIIKTTLNAKSSKLLNCPNWFKNNDEK